MLTLEMTLAQRKMKIDEMSRKAGRGNCLAGGYVRDYFMGKETKDADIFTSMPTDMTPEGFLNKAAAILRRFGKEPDIEGFREINAAYGDRNDFVVVKSIDKEDTYGPIDIIFNPNYRSSQRSNFVSTQFDLPPSMFYMDTIHTPQRTAEGRHWLITQKIVLPDDPHWYDKHLDGLKDRLDRLWVKYPRTIVSFPSEALGWDRMMPYYQQLLQGGLIGEGDIREVLPQEAL